MQALKFVQRLGDQFDVVGLGCGAHHGRERVVVLGQYLGVGRSLLLAGAGVVYPPCGETSGCDPWPQLRPPSSGWSQLRMPRPPAEGVDAQSLQLAGY